MSTRPRTILQLIHNLDTGGAQEVVRTLAAYLPEAGWQPVVASFKDGPLRPVIEQMGIPVVIIPARQHTVLALPYFLQDLARIRRTLADLITQYEISVIQTHLLRSLDFLVLTLRSHPRAPLVFWTIHNSQYELRAQHLSTHRWLLKPKQLAYRWLYQLCGRWVNGFIAVSPDVKTALVQQGGVPDSKITVICNGVDVQRYNQATNRTQLRQALGLEAEAQLFILVATFKVQKGHRCLLDAIAPLLPAWPHLHLLLVGDGELRPELEAHAQALGLTSRVHFLGNRPDVPDLLGASDYFVLPSLWEGLPMALIEAMAAALPIIASDVSGTRQVMVPGETGLMVPPGDVAELRAALLTLLNNPTQAQAMGAAAYQRVSACFSARQQATAHAHLYQTCRNSGER
jgi:glycosyltransferase involved in cell wall biosynthesis